MNLKQESKKIIVLCMVGMFIFVALETTVFVGNEFHHRHCHSEKCSVCALINVANQLSKNAISQTSNIAFLAVIIFALQISKKYIINVAKPTLVDFKVIQNN